jgi:DNA-directed RNA polymerase subunit M/transcription elongation factor TFIIS
MNFCEVCSNMKYIKINSENNNMVYYCKHCSFEKDEISSKAIKISETIYTEDELLYNQHINNYLRFDPTLRRIKDDNIVCTNCDIPDEKRQIIPIKYHPSNMKYFYVCDNCGFTWRENKK